VSQGAAIPLVRCQSPAVALVSMDHVHASCWYLSDHGKFLNEYPALFRGYQETVDLSCKRMDRPECSLDRSHLSPKHPLLVAHSKSAFPIFAAKRLVLFAIICAFFCLQLRGGDRSTSEQPVGSSQPAANVGATTAPGMLSQQGQPLPPPVLAPLLSTGSEREGEKKRRKERSCDRLPHVNRMSL
jgi:hypothetical protein